MEKIAHISICPVIYING